MGMQNGLNFNFGGTGTMFNPMFNSPMMNPMMNQMMPWWGMKGNMYYPNMNFPGAWQGHGMNHQHYPGNGPVMMAKPNIYVEAKEEIEFELEFTDPKQEFLATTPYLEEGNKWKVKVKDEKFNVDGVDYGYLFYDARGALKHFQFADGVCSSREAMIEMMEKDLKALGHSKRSLKDFSVHWRVKIPNYPYYCLYPQYNQEMDKAVPINVSVEAEVSRVLYIVVPYQTLELKNTDVFPPLPVNDFTAKRPKVKQQTKLYLKEWGVAFLIDQAIKR
jgi:hypothetical protein